MWAQVVNAIIGIWLMASPAFVDYNSEGQNNCYVIGPLIVTFAAVAWWEGTKGVRKFNIPLDWWLLLAPCLLAYTACNCRAHLVFSAFLIVLPNERLDISKSRSGLKVGGSLEALKISLQHPASAPDKKRKLYPRTVTTNSLTAKSLISPKRIERITG